MCCQSHGDDTSTSLGVDDAPTEANTMCAFAPLIPKELVLAKCRLDIFCIAPEYS